MQKLFVFAIGGTGERVLRSFTMLLAAGVPTFDNYEVYPIIIDYDTGNADKKRTVELLQNYNAAHNAAFTHHPLGVGERQFFAAKSCNLAGLTNYVFPFKPSKPDEKFREHIGYDGLAGDTLHTKWLLQSLYDESQRPDTELNLNMNVGFKGNPNIGSVVFHDINKAVEFTKFTSLFQPGNGDKVVIIGSLFGGTGASGIPEIVKAIDANTKGANVATILVLPYFEPMESGKGETDAIKASRFNSKTKAALSFYQDSGLMDKIDKVYYVGDPYPTKLSYCDGGDQQKNEANIVELISAMMIEHYVAERDKQNKEFKFSLKTNIVVGDGEKSSLRLFLNDFDNGSVKCVLNHLAELAIALKLLHDEIVTGNASSKDFYKYLEDAVEKVGVNSEKDKYHKLCSELKSFYDKFQEWLKELDFEGEGNTKPGNSHRLALCDMKKDYSDIVLKEAVAGDNNSEKGTAGRIREYLVGGGSKPALTADFLFARMNHHIKDDGKGNGHYDTKKNALRDEHYPEWVFADILHRSAVDGLTKLNEQEKN